MSFLAKLYNRRSEESIESLNRRFLDAIPRDWDHSEAFEKQLTKTLLKFVDNGADIDAQDHLGWTALARLAMWGFTQPAIALIERKANINVKDKCDGTALKGAAQNNNVALLKCMLDHGATDLDQKFMSSGIMWSAVAGTVNGQEDQEKKIACVKMLLDAGLPMGPEAKPYAWRCPYLAPYCPGLAEAKEIEAAMEAGDIAKIRELNEKGFKPDILAEYGQDTPLFKAARKGDIAMMKELIEMGSNLDIMCPWSNRTPLMAAAESGNIEAVDLLFDSGVEVEAHIRYERHAYDEPGHSEPDVFSSSHVGGPAMVQRIKEIFGHGIVVQRRTKIMKPLRLGK